MDTLLLQKDLIFEIKQQVENRDPSLYSHVCIYSGEFPIDENTISVVMTSSNRSKQTFFTLEKFKNSSYKNVQVIIVDDSTHDPITEDILRLQNFPINIDLINIKRENKKWHNPLVNYNIGFNYISGGKIIIQNAEVVHVGDVLQFVNDVVKDDNNYYVFDVKASSNYDTNEQIYNSNINTIEIFNEKYFEQWYQSKHEANRNYHFLTAIHKKTFSKINNFGYDCTMGTCYDDDEFVLKIISKNINIVNIWHDEFLVGGIHLFHGNAGLTWDNGKEHNVILFMIKKRIYYTIFDYIDVTEDKDNFENKFKILYLVYKLTIDLSK